MDITYGDKAMGSKSQAPVGSRWRFNTESQGRVFVVTERKPGGVVCVQQEGRAYFGQTYLKNFLAAATRLPDATA